MRDGTYIIGREGRRWRADGPTDGGREHRGSRQYLVLPHPTVSQRHAELVVLGGRCYLTDLGSTNGTWRFDGAEPCPHREGYVDPHEPLRFGAVQCRLADLFRDPVAEG